MKLVCIDNTLNLEHLTVGKIYISREIFNDLYYIITDNGQELLYPKSSSLFKKIDEYRNEKINQILE